MPSVGSQRNLVIRIAVGAVLVLATAAAGWLIVDSLALALHMPAQLNYIDGFMVDDVQRFTAGDGLYPDPSTPPYTVTVYTPGFMVAMAGLMRFGLDGFAAGRLLVLGSMLLLAVIIALVGARRLGWVALVVVLAFVLHPLQWPWSLVIRPDMTAALLSAVAVVVASRNANRHAWWVAAVLCLAAGLTKQTSVAAPAAILVWYLVKDRRLAVRFIMLLGTMAAASVVVLQWMTGGQFLFHTVLANVNPFSIQRALGMMRSFVTADPLPIIVLAIMALRAIRSRSISVFSAYSALAFAAAFSAGKAGSSMNYFLEPLAAAALWAAAEFPIEWFDRRRPYGMVVAGLLFAVFVLTSVTTVVERAKAHRVARAMVPVHGRLVDTVAATDGLVVSDDATALVGAGKRVHFRPFIMTQLADAGRWDQQPFVEQLRRGEIGMVVVQIEPRSVFDSRYTPEMQQALEHNYGLAFNYLLGARFAVFVPRGAE